MTQEVIYKDENLLLEYFIEGNYIHETWWGLTPSSIFRKHLEVIVDALYQKKADGLILDAREHKGLVPSDQRLAAKKHEEYAKKHGILKQAIMVPADVYSKHSVNNYTKQFDIDKRNQIRFFLDIPSAENWLKST